MNRREIKKNRIAFKIWTAVPRVEKYKIGAAVQILETISALFYFATIHIREVSHKYNDSFTIGQPTISVTGHWRIHSYSKKGEPSCRCKLCDGRVRREWMEYGKRSIIEVFFMKNLRLLYGHSKSFWKRSLWACFEIFGPSHLKFILVWMLLIVWGNY